MEIPVLICRKDLSKLTVRTGFQSGIAGKMDPPLCFLCQDLCIGSDENDDMVKVLQDFSKFTREIGGGVARKIGEDGGGGGGSKKLVSDTANCCSDCVTVMKSVIDEKENVDLVEAGVRKLQLELLMELKRLQEMLRSLQGKMGRMEGRICAGGTWMDKEAKEFKTGIINAVQGLNMFSHKITSRVSAGNPTNDQVSWNGQPGSVIAASDVIIKLENEEESNLEDAYPCSPFPDHWENESDEETQKNKLSQSSTCDDEFTPKRKPQPRSKRKRHRGKLDSHIKPIHNSSNTKDRAGLLSRLLLQRQDLKALSPEVMQETLYSLIDVVGSMSAQLTEVKGKLSTFSNVPPKIFTRKTPGVRGAKTKEGPKDDVDKLQFRDQDWQAPSNNAEGDNDFGDVVQPTDQKPSKRKLGPNLPKKEEAKNKRLRVKCPHCDLVTHKMNLDSHVKRIHEKVFNFYCEMCGKGESDKRDMEYHQAVAHGICSVQECKQEFPGDRQGLRSHQLEAHGKEINVFACDVCDKLFVRMHHMRKHRMIHESHKGIKTGEEGEGGGGMEFLPR